MRIRKRIPPPSLPCLSDPQLTRPAVVQQLKREINPCQQNTNNESLPSDLPNLRLPQPSDQPDVSERKSTSWVLFGGNSNQEKMKEKDVESAEDENRREKVKSFGCNDNDNNRNENVLTPKQAGSLLLQLSSTSSDLDESWREREKVIPLKKRRDSYHYKSINTIEQAKMKSKTNKKCPQESCQEVQKEETNGINEEGFHSTTSSDKAGVKKNKRGSVILEGSRCSRVNGRGWRCCQQTLVGYSLCEHHLGKGRLRSMTSVRNAAKKKKEDDDDDKSLPNIDNMEGENVKKKPIKVSRKEMKKLGMVKARSLSSLLGQTDNVVAAIKKTDNSSFPQPMWDSKKTDNHSFSQLIWDSNCKIGS